MDPKHSLSRFRHLGRISRALVTAMALVAVALAPGLLRLSTDNSPEVFFVRDSPGLEDYRTFRADFGADETLRVAVSGDALWSPEGLTWLASLEDRARQLDGVRSAAGLASHHRQRSERRVQPRQSWPPKDPEALRTAALANPLDRAAGWIGGRGEVATVLLILDGDLDTGGTARLLEELEALAAEAPAGLDCRILGLASLNRALDRSSQEIDGTYFPLLVVFTLVLLLLAVRDLRDLAAPLLFVGFCQLLLLAPMGYLGVRLNLVLAVLPPLVFAITLALALHVLLRFRQRAALGDDGVGTRAGRAAATMEEMGWSVFWTGATTSIGFASLAISPVAPIRALGLWAAIGLALATAATFVFYPALVTVLGSRRPHDVAAADFETRTGRWGAAWGGWSSRHRRSILGAAAIVALGAALGIPGIQVESNALRYLAADHPVRQGIEGLEARGIGVAALELLVHIADSGGGAPPAFGSGNEVDRLADLGAELERQPNIFGVVSAGTVLRDAALLVPTTPVNATFRLQMVLEGLSQDAQGREVLDSLLAEDRRTARLTVFMPTTKADEVARLETYVRDRAREAFPEASITTTGQYPLLLEAQRHLISTLLMSLALTLLAIAVVLRLLLPSTRLALLALLPNLWPVIGILGVMGWLGLPLDIATVMVASVVLGLAVDDTIHTLGHFRRLAPLHGAREAVSRTLHATAPAYLLTGVILMAGFGVCALSDFAPIARFGGLSAVAIGLAVLGDLFLLPALLSLTPASAVERLAKAGAATGEDGVD
ncbi:MAG: MMPL family transporter [Acidobacteriota bacterium]